MLSVYGVPSPKLFRKYLNYQQDKYGPLKGIYFRDKSYGYAGSTMALRFTSGRTISNGRELQFFKDTFSGIYQLVLLVMPALSRPLDVFRISPYSIAGISEIGTGKWTTTKGRRSF